MVLDIVPALHSLDKTQYYHKIFRDKCSMFTFVFGAKPQTFDLVCINLLSIEIEFIKILKVHEIDKVKELERSMRKNIMSSKSIRIIYNIHVIDNNLVVKQLFTFNL